MATLAATAAPAERPINRPLIVAAIMLATVMQVLDSTIANVALPHMQASLGAAQDTVTWVLTSYIVASAIALPLTGWLADRIGHKRLFLIAVAGFVVASMLCGLAQSLAEMVLFRILQGMLGAFIVPLGQAVMLEVYPKEQHGQAMAMWGMGVMIGPVLGPILGGWLTENFDWRWVFYVNLPVGVFAFAAAWAALPARGPSPRRFDLFGYAMLALGVAALQLMLDRGEQLDWFESAEVLAEAGLAVAALWMFGIHLMTGREPLYAPAMLTDRNFATSLIFVFITGVLLFSSLALLPPMLQRLYAYPIITTGLVIAPRGIGTMISMMVVGRLVSRFDPRLLVLAGLLCMAESLRQMTGFSLDMGKGPIIVSGFIQGLGFGLMTVPLNALAFATLEPRFRTEAASLFNLMRNLGSSIGISIVTFITARSLQTSHADLASAVTPFNAPLLDGNVAQQAGQAATTALAMIDLEINRQALMIAYLNDFKLLMIAALVSMPLVLVLKKPKRDGEAVHVAGE